MAKNTATAVVENVIPIGTPAAEVMKLDASIAELTKGNAGSGERIAACEQSVRDAEGARDRTRTAFLGASVAQKVGDASPAEVAALSRALQDAEIALQQAEDALMIEMQTVPARAAKIQQLKDRRRDLVMPGLLDDAGRFETDLADWIERGEQLEERARVLGERINTDARLYMGANGHLRLDSRIPTELAAIVNLLPKNSAFKTLVAKFHAIAIRLSRHEEKHPRD
jgi:hypothetical protein